MIQEHAIEQAIRISHCSNKGKEHACVGVCTITKDGVNLDCSLCGKDNLPWYQTSEWLESRAIAILVAAGLDFFKLETGVKVAVVREIAKDLCPNCKAIMIHAERFPRHKTCSCGWRWSDCVGWKPPLELTVPMMSPLSPLQRAFAAYGELSDDDKRVFDAQVELRITLGGAALPTDPEKGGATAQQQTVTSA